MPPGAAHRREVADQQARSHHVPSSRRIPWRDPRDEHQQYVEDLEMDIAAIEDELAGKRRHLAEVRAQAPEREDARADRDLPGYDPRAFGRDEPDRGVA